MRRYAFTAVLAGAAAISACSDSAPTITTPTTAKVNSTVANAKDDDAWPFFISVLPPKSPSDQAKSQGNGGGGGGGGTGIFFHGGPVLQAGTNVAAVYWAGSTIYSGGPAAGSHGAGSGDGSLVGFFLSHLGGSSYFNINTTYTDAGGAHIANVVNYTQYWANNGSVPSDGQKVTNSQIVTMLQGGFDSGSLTYDANTLYAVFTAGTVNLGGGFGTQYCAYHTSGTVMIGGVPRTALFAAMPYDAAYPGACTNGTASPNGDPGADAIVNTLAHETEETTTDLLGNAWFDRRGQENADKCAWTWGTTYTTSNGGTANMNIGGKDFLVQRNWVNAGAGGCLQTYP